MSEPEDLFSPEVETTPLEAFEPQGDDVTPFKEFKVSEGVITNFIGPDDMARAVAVRRIEHPRHGVGFQIQYRRKWPSGTVTVTEVCLSSDALHLTVESVIQLEKRLEAEAEGGPG